MELWCCLSFFLAPKRIKTLMPLDYIIRVCLVHNEASPHLSISRLGFLFCSYQSLFVFRWASSLSVSSNLESALSLSLSACVMSYLSQFSFRGFWPCLVFVFSEEMPSRCFSSHFFCSYPSSLFLFPSLSSRSLTLSSSQLGVSSVFVSLPARLSCLSLSIFISWILTLSVFVSEHNLSIVFAIWHILFVGVRHCHRFSFQKFLQFLSLCVSVSPTFVPPCVCSVCVYIFYPTFVCLHKALIALSCVLCCLILSCQ